MVSFLIPVYEEAENITDTLKALQTKVSEKIKKQVYIIYDVEDDSAIGEVNKVKGCYNFPIHLVKNKFGKGPANAIKTGFYCVKDGLVIVTMADQSDDYSTVGGMIALAERGYDLVSASRYMKGGKSIGGIFVKKLLSKTAGLLLSAIFQLPTRDATNNFKLYKKSILDALSITSSFGFEIGLEILIKAHIAGFKITETPTTWRSRNAGKSKFKLLQELPRYLKWFFYLALHQLSW